MAAAPVPDVCESVCVPVCVPVCASVGVPVCESVVVAGEVLVPVWESVVGVAVAAGGGCSAGGAWVVAVPVGAPLVGVVVDDPAEGTIDVALGVVVGVALDGVPACARTPELVGNIDVPAPVTSAPFEGASAMNAVASGT